MWQDAPDLCVGDVATAHGGSAQVTSPAVRHLRGPALQTRRDMRVVFYALDKRFQHELLSDCVRQADPSGGDDA